MKYSDERSKTKGCIAHMVVKRKCNFAKVINRRCATTYQGKVLIKRNSTQVKKTLGYDTNQAFMIGNNNWYTTSGDNHTPSGKKAEYGNQYYIDIIADLK